VIFVQTYSFFGDLPPVGKKVLSALEKKYPDIKGPADITPAVGVANAYDTVMVIAAALTKAGKTDGTALRDAFYNVENVEGLIKTYNKPFTKTNHDALSHEDYIWTHFDGDHILPVANKK
jgi:branched-chain amino acid transport system substrate-binding protein